MNNELKALEEIEIIRRKHNLHLLVIEDADIYNYTDGILKEGELIPEDKMNKIKGEVLDFVSEELGFAITEVMYRNFKE